MQKENFKSKWKELFTYGIGGVLTTLVNYLVYFGLGVLRVDYLLANTLAWAAAVIFSYWMNRTVVFGSKSSWWKEFISFAGLRLLTLGAENLLLYLAVEQLGLRTSVSKVAVSIVTVAANYVICQKHIFKKRTKEPAKQEEMQKSKSADPNVDVSLHERKGEIQHG